MHGLFFFPLYCEIVPGDELVKCTCLQTTGTAALRAPRCLALPRWGVRWMRWSPFLGILFKVWKSLKSLKVNSNASMNHMPLKVVRNGKSVNENKQSIKNKIKEFPIKSKTILQRGCHKQRLFWCIEFLHFFFDYILSSMFYVFSVSFGPFSHLFFFWYNLFKVSAISLCPVSRSGSARRWTVSHTLCGS